MTAQKGKTTKRARDARDGKFIPLKKAQKDPSHTVVETIPVRTKKKKGNK